MVFAPKSRAPISFLYEDEKFVDELQIEIKSRDATNREIYYTLDGSEATNKSAKYSEPITIIENTSLNVVIYIKKEDNLVAFTRSKEFTKIPPMPIVEGQDVSDNLNH